jgi:RNA polymerase sigma factor (sigma-70 family)
MADDSMANALRQVRRAVGVADAADKEDGELLSRHLRGDDTAFEALVRRHGPMVLAVCRRVLGQGADAEDAFQATFLVFWRKARSLRYGDRLAGWLHGVACRTAWKARATRPRWHAGGEPPAEVAGTESAAEAAVRAEVRAVLDEEVNRLPARYRLPVVLCYLQGTTFTEAARQLGWPPGTVSGRLARARELLRGRLTRRGIALSAGTMATLLAEEAPAAVPAGLAHVTTGVAALAGGTTAASGKVTASVLALAERTVKAMFLTKVKLVSLVVLALGGAGAGLWAATRPQPVAKPPAAPAQVVPPARAVAPAFKARPAEAAPQVEENVKVAAMDEKAVQACLDLSPAPDRVKVLMRERHANALMEFRTRWQQFVGGRGTCDILMGSSLRLREAEKGLNTMRQTEVEAAENHFQRLKELEEIVVKAYEAGRMSLADACQVRFYRLDAEIDAARARSK